MRAVIARWSLGPALSIALAAGGVMAAAIPAHAQWATGLGQADQQFTRCQVLTRGDLTCGNSSQDEPGTSWQLSTLPVEPALGRSPCRRGVANE